MTCKNQVPTTLPVLFRIERDNIPYTHQSWAPTFSSFIPRAVHGFSHSLFISTRIRSKGQLEIEQIAQFDNIYKKWELSIVNHPPSTSLTEPISIVKIHVQHHTTLRCQPVPSIHRQTAWSTIIRYYSSSSPARTQNMLPYNQNQTSRY